jgi:hypothetical protein
LLGDIKQHSPMPITLWEFLEAVFSRHSVAVRFTESQQEVSRVVSSTRIRTTGDCVGEDQQQLTRKEPRASSMTASNDLT